MESRFFCHNPLKRVKFISMDVTNPDELIEKFAVTIPSNGSSLFQYQRKIEERENYLLSQSPQTGQVYFNKGLSHFHRS